MFQVPAHPKTKHDLVDRARVPDRDGGFVQMSPHLILSMLVAIYNSGNLLLVPKDSGVDPRVPRLVMDHDGGALGAEQLTIVKNLKVAIYEMPVRAVLILCARRQATGTGGYSRRSSVTAACCCGQIPEVPVELFVNEGR